MKLEVLEQYRNLLEEARMWEKELNELRRNANVVKDTVRGSMSSFPYTSHTVTIIGTDTKFSNKIERREKRLAARRERLADMLEEIDDFIDSLEDSQLRQIVQYRYVKGYSWVKTAQMVHNKESTVKKRVYRFFSKGA